jgi:hypothetical protein
LLPFLLFVILYGMDTNNPKEKRNCIFTNLPANTKLQISKGWSEKHNWAKNVPCTKEYLKKRGKYPFNDIELRLVQTFYEIEVAKITIKALEDRMEHLRGVLQRDFTKEVMEHSIEDARKEFYRLHAAAEPMTPEEVDLDTLLIEGTEEYFEEVDLEKTQPTEITKKTNLQEQVNNFSLTEQESSDTIKKVVIKKKATLWD